MFFNHEVARLAVTEGVILSRSPPVDLQQPPPGVGLLREIRESPLLVFITHHPI